VRILFVCTGNIDRSKTAEEMFKNVEGVEVRSAGVNIAATIHLSRELINWADRIFVMEHKHQKAVLEIDHTARKKVDCLDIPDQYYYGQPELKRILIEKLRSRLSSIKF
jgi:predicted protein tyrosine phosphatase